MAIYDAVLAAAAAACGMKVVAPESDVTLQTEDPAEGNR
jgi:hypothetical protein